MSRGEIKNRSISLRRSTATSQNPTGEKSMKKFAFILALAVLAASPTFADNMPVNADGLKWGAAPPVLPKGARSRSYRGTHPKTDFMYCG